MPDTKLPDAAADDTCMRFSDNAQYHEQGTPRMFELDTMVRDEAAIDVMRPTPIESSDGLLADHHAHSGDDQHHKRQQQKPSRARKRTAENVRPIRTCFILAMPWAAYSVLNTVFEDIRVPYMVSMDMGEFVPRFIPPLIALFLGPILGAASDRSLSKWGRRNVFLVSGAVMLTISGVLFSSAQTLFKDYKGLTNLLFFLLAIGLVLLNIGLRARLMDEVPIQYQVHAQAALTFWAGVGAVLGNLLFRNTTVVVYATDISGTDFLISFSAAMGSILVATAVCIWLRPEHPQDRPAFHPPLDRLVQEVKDQIVYAPRLFRVLCLVYFVQYFAWNAFRDEAYTWWAKNVYKGCKDGADCGVEQQEKYKDGLDTANRGLMCQNGLQLVVCLLILLVIPLDIGYRLKRIAVAGLSIGAAALIGAVAVGSAWLPVTFAAFVAIVFYQIVIAIFPYSVVGIMGKEIQESRHGFNNNGLYIGVLTSFSAVSQLFVQIYGTEGMSPLGTGNVMALPCILFVAGIVCTVAFTFTHTRTSSLVQTPKLPGFLYLVLSFRPRLDRARKPGAPFTRVLHDSQNHLPEVVFWSATWVCVPDGRKWCLKRHNLTEIPPSIDIAALSVST